MTAVPPGSALPRRRALGLLALAGLGGAAAACSSSPPPAPGGPVPAVLATLRTVWTGRPDGPLPENGDEGRRFVPVLTGSDTLPSVQDGALVGNLPDARAAAYLYQDLKAPVRLLGASFGFGEGSDEGAMTLVAWVPLAGLTASCHLAVTPRRWIMSVANGYALSTVREGEFPAPLPQDGSPLRVEARMRASAMELSLPDGSSAAFSDPRIAVPAGSVPCWEFYRNAPGGASVRMFEIWAG